jgi:DNA-binding NtrC family response regulator
MDKKANPYQLAMEEEILIVEGDPNLSEIMSVWMAKNGFKSHRVSSGKEALRKLQESEYNVIFLDLGLPDIDGFDVLQKIRQMDALAQVIIVTAHQEVNAAAKAIRLGALNYIVKPFDHKILEGALNRALEHNHIVRSDMAAALVHSNIVFPSLISVSPAMKSVVSMISKAVGSDVPIMIQGESGCGKELVARTIHLSGPFRDTAFLAVNCASISESLLESELFGHEKGAFTGADKRHRGLFEVATTGTLFLDEVGDMSHATQASLLRVLDTGEFRRVGGTINLYTNARILVATNKDLVELKKEGKFREDLYYRLNTMVIELPPLRARKEDIWPLAQYFLEIIVKRMGEKKTFARGVRKILENYNWPGNVRELRNIIERLVILSEGHDIQKTDLPVELFNYKSDPESGILSLEQVTKAAEKKHITELLKRNKGNRRTTAQQLKISEPTLYRKLKEYGFATD